MFSESDEALTGVEKKMLDAFETAYAEWEETMSPLPMSLVKLGETVHRMVLARLGKRGGMNMAEMMKNPGAALVHLEKMKAQLLKMIAQQERLRATPTTEPS